MPPPSAVTSGSTYTLTYVAGASLAAATLVYVFGPTFFQDQASSSLSSSQRRKSVVGLINAANDCFINSVLQTLAGCGDLRVYLAQRVRLAKELGEVDPQTGRVKVERKGVGGPSLTEALKEILDQLNERPINRKVISPKEFLGKIEKVFRQRISRTQQDAQEFLQVVMETVAEEYWVQQRVRRKRMALMERGGEDKEKDEKEEVEDVEDDDEDEGMPMEGKLEASIQCTVCGYRPKPTVSTFVVLTLSVPQSNSASLGSCINDIFSTEYIDDFQCAKCRLNYAILHYKKSLVRLTTTSPSTDPADIRRLEMIIARLESSDPEKPPPDIPLPPPQSCPKSRIARKTRMSHHPNILAIHLSRSIYMISSSRKNSCKVAFPETLSLGVDAGGSTIDALRRRNTMAGPIVQEKRSETGYRLLGMITHKGGHDSGHYEAYRRQVVARGPYSNPNRHTPLPAGLNGTPVPSGATTPAPTLTPPHVVVLDEDLSSSSSTIRPGTAQSRKGAAAAAAAVGGLKVNSLTNSVVNTPPASTTPSSSSSLKLDSPSSPSTASSSSASSTISSPSVSSSTASSSTPSRPSTNNTAATPTAAASTPKGKAPTPTQQRHHHHRQHNTKKMTGVADRWFRISDDKIKESRTSDVLALQKEVYILFYERRDKDESPHL